MLIPRLRAFFVLTIGSLVTGALTLGCAKATVEDVCNTCPSDSKEVARCIEQGTNEQDLAEKAGCGAEFQALIDCAQEKAICDGQGHLSAEACNPEEHAVEKCGSK